MSLPTATINLVYKETLVVRCYTEMVFSCAIKRPESILIELESVY